MNSEKRIILFVALTFAWFVGMQYLGDALGLNPPPPPAQKPPAVAAGQAGGPQARGAQGGGAPGPARPRRVRRSPRRPRPSAPRSRWPSRRSWSSNRIGWRSSSSRPMPASSRWSRRSTRPSSRPGSRVIARSPSSVRTRSGSARNAPPSMLVTLVPTPDGKATEPEAAAATRPSRSTALPWEVVRDAEGRAVRPVTKEASNPKGAPVKGQEIRFRKTRRRARRGPDQDLPALRRGGRLRIRAGLRGPGPGPDRSPIA